MVRRKSSEGTMELNTVEEDQAQSERVILSQLRAEDRSNLGELIDRYGEDLMRYLAAILASRESAEDMFQDLEEAVLCLLDHRGGCVGHTGGPVCDRGATRSR